MPIQVTCPNCLKRFQVSDKFAGKQGPCPACKKTIRVPDASEAVTIHAPETEGPKDSKGQSVLKPITRKDTDFTRRHLSIAVGVVFGMLFLALGFRFAMGGAPFWAQILGILLLAPPIVRTGYSFVHDAELEPYAGVELRNRVLICSAIYAAIWLVYAFVPAYVLELDHANEMSWTTAGIVFSVMILIGAAVSVGAFELEFINGLAQSGLYFVVVILLALVAGVSLAGQPGARRELDPDWEDEEFVDDLVRLPSFTGAAEAAVWEGREQAWWVDISPQRKPGILRHSFAIRAGTDPTVKPTTPPSTRSQGLGTGWTLAACPFE